GLEYLSGTMGGGRLASVGSAPGLSSIARMATLCFPRTAPSPFLNVVREYEPSGAIAHVAVVPGTTGTNRTVPCGTGLPLKVTFPFTTAVFGRPLSQPAVPAAARPSRPTATRRTQGFIARFLFSSGRKWAGCRPSKIRQDLAAGPG